MKVVIVGGVAGGATAAARIRRLDESAKIVVFERSGFVSYANCGLPYYIGGTITDPKMLTLQTPESFRSRFRVDVRVRHEVTAIHPERKSVTGLALMGEFEESFDRSARPGAKHRSPGARLSLCGYSPFGTWEGSAYRSFIERVIRPRRRFGGGIIRCSLAESLRRWEWTSYVRARNSSLRPWTDNGSLIHGKLRQEGVKLMFGSTVEGFAQSGGGLNVMLRNEPALRADMVILAIGVTPDSALAKAAGLELGINGSIAVNERMETSAPDIYAVGDAVEVRHSVTGQKALIALAGPANKQGRIAADNICGGNSVYHGSQGSSVIKVFDMTVATTGINEQTAKQAGLDYDKIYLSPASHASYYPGAQALTMKIVFERGSYKLLGAQIVGYEGAEKRIDVLSTAIRAGLAGYELKDLDLAYAPPYSSAKDPVNMAGYMFDNLMSGRLRQFFWDEIDSLPRDGSVTLLDTRTKAEYACGHVEGFITSLTR